MPAYLAARLPDVRHNERVDAVEIVVHERGHALSVEAERLDVRQRIDEVTRLAKLVPRERDEYPVTRHAEVSARELNRLLAVRPSDPDDGASTGVLRHVRCQDGPAVLH